MKWINTLKLLFLFSIFNISNAQNYYLYVASESDDTVSLLKFNGKNIEEKDEILDRLDDIQI